MYATTGQPRPRDIEQVAHWLLNEPFAEARAAIARLQQERGLALVDIVRGLLPFVMQLNVPPRARVAMLVGLADVEHRLAYVTGEKLQLGAVVGIFTHVREAIVAAAR